MNIYVGNLPFSVTESELRATFEAFGGVSDVKLIMDRETGRPRGFAFVEMQDEAAARGAIEGLNGKDLNGRALKVNEARPREERAGGGGRGAHGGAGPRGRDHH